VTKRRRCERDLYGLAFLRGSSACWGSSIVGYFSQPVPNGSVRLQKNVCFCLQRCKNATAIAITIVSSFI
jgi:hypothetical protein